MKNTLLWLSLVALWSSSPQTVENHLLPYRQQLTTTLSSEDPQASSTTADFPCETLDQSLDKEQIFLQAIDKVIGGKSPIKFDKEHVQKEVYKLLSLSFDIRWKELIFLKPNTQILLIIAKIIESMRLFIKKNDKWLAKFLLGPSNFQSFLKSKDTKFYDNLLQIWNLHYYGGEKQFSEDYRSVIN